MTFGMPRIAVRRRWQCCFSPALYRHWRAGRQTKPVRRPARARVWARGSNGQVTAETRQQHRPQIATNIFAADSDCTHLPMVCKPGAERRD